MSQKVPNQSEVTKTDTVHDQTREDTEVKVLYQKLGAKWYAFSLVDDEIFIGSVPEQVIREANSIDRK